MSYEGENSLKQRMNQQQKLGYPRFKNRIVRKLVENYDVSIEKATSLVSSPKVSDKIDIDIEWAQHMGADFWATEIFENFITKNQYAFN